MKLLECSHCGRPIPLSIAYRLRREIGKGPLLCRFCISSGNNPPDENAEG